MLPYTFLSRINYKACSRLYDNNAHLNPFPKTTLMSIRWAELYGFSLVRRSYLLLQCTWFSSRFHPAFSAPSPLLLSWEAPQVVLSLVSTTKASPFNVTSHKMIFFLLRFLSLLFPLLLSLLLFLALHDAQFTDIADAADHFSVFWDLFVILVYPSSFSPSGYLDGS